GGVLAFNLSNRYLDLDPVMGRQAEDAGLVCRIGPDTKLTPEQRDAGKQPSIWAVMAATEGNLASLASDPRWRLPNLRPHAAVWTADCSDPASYRAEVPFVRGAGEADAPVDRRLVDEAALVFLGLLVANLDGERPRSAPGRQGRFAIDASAKTRGIQLGLRRGELIEGGDMMP